MIVVCRPPRKKLEVGDIVLLRDDEQVPADIAVLSTADADGVCYVETKNLDGETNLKVRKSLKGTANINSEEDVEHARFMVDAEPPTANLYTFNAVLKYSSREPAPDDEPRRPAATDASLGSTGSAWKDKIEPITINELLLRGCTIRNSGWIIGLVLFTGRDTKIMMNGGDTPVGLSCVPNVRRRPDLTRPPARLAVQAIQD
jgi:phospholipid-translocating ATPase